ncbi:hypothetical protein Ccrd_005726 [Cynara cardunculus var. scolymus]|uniref:Uncharacterized protein n=1 Tax=Cynara cardunculus var. scolymus TaxID=59895 RepID=A0A103XK45_CYNCS|nr:hypothetical protein Ccrd_005726 [Cynara cardunculus var. scolymus]
MKSIEQKCRNVRKEDNRNSFLSKINLQDCVLSSVFDGRVPTACFGGERAFFAYGSSSLRKEKRSQLSCLVALHVFRAEKRRRARSEPNGISMGFDKKDESQKMIILHCFEDETNANLDYKAMFSTDSYPTLLSLKIHHGGLFTKAPDMKYINEWVGKNDMMIVSSNVEGDANTINLEDFESNSDENELETDRKKQLKNLRRNKADSGGKHQFCLRHIHENMKHTWKGKLYKDHLWMCATATTIPQFDKEMDKVKKLDIGLYEWLKKIPPHHWARSHFTG